MIILAPSDFSFDAGRESMAAGNSALIPCTLEHPSSRGSIAAVSSDPSKERSGVQERSLAFGKCPSEPFHAFRKHILDS